MKSFYISRKKAEEFTEDIESAIQNPSESPLLHYAYGIGGIGKSTLLREIFTTNQSKYQCVECSFHPKSRDEKSSIATPIELMLKLNEQLPDRDGWEGNPFQETYTKWQKAIRDLKNEVSQEKSEEEKKNKLELVKQAGNLLKSGATLWGTINTGGASSAAVSAGGLLAEKGLDTLTQGVSSLVQIQDLVKKSKTAKDNPELQELLTNPLKELTKAFIKTIVNKSQNKPIILFVDTYEKASPDFDTYFCQLVLSESKLHNSPVRIVMAGRYSLSSSRYQRLFQPYRSNVITETRLDKFNEKETKNYLQEIGIENKDKIRQIWKATKGYPYYLNLIKEQKEQGKEIKLHRGGKDIVDLLLQGLDETEKKVVTLAAYCRWFDEQLIEYLLEENSISESSQNYSSWFDWLTELDFVIENEHYSLDDVARDIIRQTEHKNKEKSFQSIHKQLADYFQERADVEVEDEESLEEQYEYPEWCEYITESIYHSLYASKKQGQIKLLTYFFQGAYFKKPEIAMNSYGAVIAESDLEDKEFKLLPGNTKSFLKSVSLAIGFGWLVINKSPQKYQFDFNVRSEKKDIDKNFKDLVEFSLDKLFEQVKKLRGIARCWGLIGVYYRSNSSIEDLRLLEEAEIEIERLELFDYKKLCFEFYLNYGTTLNQLKRYKEVLENYEKTIKMNPNSSIAWFNKASILSHLEKTKEALIGYEKAIEIDPKYFSAWFNRGTVLGDLQRYEEELKSYEKAIEINPEFSPAWSNRASALSHLGRFEEAFKSCNKAIEISPEDSNTVLYIANKGIILARQGRYLEALKFCNLAISKDPLHEASYYSKACYFALQNNEIQALENLGKAIEISPRRSRHEAKVNPDFDRMRDNPLFKSLVEGT